MKRTDLEERLAMSDTDSGTGTATGTTGGGKGGLAKVNPPEPKPRDLAETSCEDSSSASGECYGVAGESGKTPG
jgi:hypothetical protein